jgi:nitrous oxidase accessory protein
MKSGILVIMFLNILCITRAAVIVVHPGSKLSSIRNAISIAVAGDTIEIYPGLYKEGNIIVDKKLYIRGINYPVLDGEKKFEILSLKANGITVEGLQLQHGGYSSYNDIAAIKIYNASSVTIRNNRLFDTFFAIYSLHGSFCTIERNNIRSAAKNELSSANGIHCWKSDHMMIRNNYISGHRDGIYFEFVTYSIIRENISTGNVRYGLHFMFSHENSYILNTFSDNGAGVAVMYSHHVKMIGNTFSNNWGGAAYGLLLKDISDSKIQANQFTANTCGIYMEGTNRIAVNRNRFSHNGWAVKIQASCNDNSINYNNFIANTFDVATNGSLVLNNFNHNYWDKYEGYDLNRNKIGDIPFRPVTLYSMIVEQDPTTLMLFRSVMVTLLDKAEKVIPGITPFDLKDDYPFMKPIAL